MNLFDICIITASSPKQAKVFQALLERRKSAGLYPREIDFKVYSDPVKGRIGSGGGTLLAIHNLLKDYNIKDSLEFFCTHKILILHAGGESRRLPCYAPEGKLFAPIPVGSSSIMPPVVLDVQLNLFLKYPWKQGELLVGSGDVLIDFDPSSVKDSRHGICGFAKPVSFETGSRHGVFKFDAEKNRITDFYQKLSPAYLGKHAVLEGSNDCALDMGLLSFEPEAANKFVELSGESLGAGKCFIDEIKNGTASFDIYLEVLTAAIPGINEGDFVKRVISRTRLPKTLLKKLFKYFRPHKLSGVLTNSTTFLHFGSLKDFPASCEEMIQKELMPFYHMGSAELKPQDGAIIVYNSTNANFYGFSKNKTLVENCRDCSIATVMGDNLIMGLNGAQMELEVPQGICIDQRRLSKVDACMVYSTDDTFGVQKDLDNLKFCGIGLSHWLKERKLKPSDIFSSDKVFDLWDAKLFGMNAQDPMLTGYWHLPADPDWGKRFKALKRYSIREINDKTDVLDRDMQRAKARAISLRSQILNNAGWRNICLSDFVEVFKDSNDEVLLQSICKDTDNPLLREYRAELLKSLSSKARNSIVEDQNPIQYISNIQHVPKNVGIKVDQIVWARSPVRLDLAGGWSDTPPYTLRNGGKVVNVAVNLNGQPPIQVFCRRTSEPIIRFHSIDLGMGETIGTFSQLNDYQSPTSPFSLPKAALCLLGFGDQSGKGSLKTVLKKLGCGMEITLLSAIPKGSGLGTSSVLAATILGALHRAFGQRISQEDIIRQVLQMEQMLTTGGGWQDQIGGLTGGVKYLESQPGLKPSPIVYQLDSHLFMDEHCKNSMTLFYTGITRLAKNILGEVVGHFNSMSPAFLFTLERVKQLALDVRKEIALRDLQGVARCVQSSWEANKRIHPSTTNPQIDKMLSRLSPYYSGVKLLGAGGGGYAFFVSDSPDSASKLRQRLQNEFEDEKARIVDFSLNTEGLKVSVS